jgi:chemotaxis response regulator CheB
MYFAERTTLTVTALGSCVLFGMPKKAIELDVVDRVLPLNAILQRS